MDGDYSWTGIRRAIENRLKPVENAGWNEVQFINSYAVFMGYISMAIKGLGFLVLTWTTVVLLGGFVSVLQKKDFWCLTFITLVQMAGIFDVALNEKLRYIMNATSGLVVGIYLRVMGENMMDIDSGLEIISRLLLAFALVVVQLMVCATLVCPLALIYVFGILISAGISLWRLIEHDYMGNSEGEASNLVPALNTLYYLALLQGVLFCYKFFFRPIGTGLAKELARNKYEESCDDSEVELVSNYLRETRRGCEKDPSFAKGRNLITHAVDMIGSQSPADCDSGVKIMYTAICFVERELVLEECEEVEHSAKLKFREQQKLLKHLVLSKSSSRHILQKLLETMDSRGMHDRAVRIKAAMIVERIALDINLEQFPGGIEHISSLIGTFQQYSISDPCLSELLAARRGKLSPEVHRELQKDYKELLLQGLCIIQKLAANGNNCRVINNTQDLVSKIMAPVTSDLIHHTTDDHGAWIDVVEQSMEVMIELTGAPGETGTKLRREISSCKEAIDTLQRILRCRSCYDGLLSTAIAILTRLYMDTESSRCGVESVLIRSCSREDFVRRLVDIFTNDDTYMKMRMRIVSADALSLLCRHGGISDVITVVQTGGSNVIDSLTEVLVLDTDDTACRQPVTTILDHLCTQYTKHDACYGELKKAMADVMPQVIGEILCHCDRIPRGKEADRDGFAKAKADIENQSDDSSDSDINPYDYPFLVKQSTEAANFLSSLLSLCGTVYDTFITELGPGLAREFHDTNFIDKLKETVLKISDYPRDENLLVLKGIGQMVISMIKHDGGKLVNKEDLKSLIEALSSAWKNMQELDYSMVFSFANSCGTIDFTTVTPSKLNSCTLAFVVKEAQEWYAKMPSTSASD